MDFFQSFARDFDSPSPGLGLLVIPLRSFMFAFPSWLPARYFSLMACVLFMVGVMFSVAYRTAPIKTRADKFALIHGTMYFLASYFAFAGDRASTIPLGLDLLLGCGVFAHRQLRD